jgi:hypothetical protein
MTGLSQHPSMSTEKKAFIPVDELMPRVTLDGLLDYFRVEPRPEIAANQQQIRTRCFLLCGRTGDTGDRALAIDYTDPTKRWKCFETGCGKSGNLLTMCHLLGGEDTSERVRGPAFKKAAEHLAKIVAGQPRNEDTEVAATPATVAVPPPRNVPLAESENEKARGLVTLDEKFLRPSQVKQMTRFASRYFRVRSWLTDELATLFRVGYLPSDTGGDHSGGTMRGKVVYGWPDEKGQLLTWFGRDPEFEAKHEEWLANGKHGKEPVKFRVVKGFQRGLELYGQHMFPRLDKHHMEGLHQLGLPIVAGPNDVLRLISFGMPSLALCSPEYRISPEQADKVAALARQFAGRIVTIFLPCTAAGESGMKQLLGALAQRAVGVQLAWTGKMYEGQFQNRETEALRMDEWLHKGEYFRTRSPSIARYPSAKITH